MGKNRNYNCPDVDMLMASKTIAESLKANISELSTTRSDWTEQYATDLGTRIDNAIENNLGVDAKKGLRNATTALHAIQAPAMRDLSFFKTQIDDDFKKEPSQKNEILKTLGFSTNLRAVQNGNQEALIRLLYAFKTNITEEMRTEITAKGLAGPLIDKIIDYAATFQQANVTQESQKEMTREISQDTVDIFNGIYDEIIGICKKASNYYRYEPLKKALFTFRKVLRNLGIIRKTAGNTDSEQAA
jgi:hypothetical protein